VIAAVTAERMVERVTPQGRDVSVLEAIYQGGACATACGADHFGDEADAWD